MRAAPDSTEGAQSLRARAPRRILGTAAIVLLSSITVAGAIHRSPIEYSSASGLVGPLAVSGSTIVDSASGHVVNLKGVNAPVEGFDPASIATIKSWGGNFARVTVSDDRYVQSCRNETYQPGYVSSLLAEVNALTSAGVFVVIVDGSTNPGCAFARPQTSSVAPLPGPDALTMFASLAQTLGSNPLVGFEPYNEPQVCPDGAQAGSVLVPASQLDQDLELVYPQNALTDVSSRTSVPTYGTCDGWVGGYPNASASNWSQEQADSLAAHALFNGGTVLTQAGFDHVSYAGQGFQKIVDTLRSNGASRSLIFLDSNIWATDPSTFDYVTPQAKCESDATGIPFAPCWNNLSNYVGVEHYYSCQWASTDLGITKDTCGSAAPESCRVISADLGSLLSDPSTGQAWSVPVVVDEFGWPQSAPLPGTTIYYGNDGKPIFVYQHGLFMQNVVSYLDAHNIGWAAFSWDNADQDYGQQSPYVLESNAPTPTASNAPWLPNEDGAPIKASMQGQSLPCQEPPPGFG